MPAKSIPPGTVFGKLTVLGVAPARQEPSGKFPSRSFCICSCGKETNVTNAHLKSGHTKSCGCFEQESRLTHSTIHGHSRNGKDSKTLKTFNHMHSRCYNPNDNKFERYGGRGIKVCERWHQFPNFLDDLGESPIGKSIDRINNDGNYSCGKCRECLLNGWPMNCKYSTPKEQCRNQSTNRILTVRGVTGPLAELAEKFQKDPDAVWNRLKLGWSTEDAFFAPRRVNQYG